MVVLLLFLYGDDSISQVGWIDGGRPSGGDGTMGEVVDALGLEDVVDGGGLVGDEGASGGLDGDGTGSGEGVVGVANGIEVDPKGDGYLAHGGHFLAGLQDAGTDGAKQLVADLDVDGNAGWLDMEGVQHLYACMMTLIQVGCLGPPSRGAQPVEGIGMTWPGRCLDLPALFSPRRHEVTKMD